LLIKQDWVFLTMQNLIDKLINNLSLTLVGREMVIQLVLAALLGRGHALLEDVPGVGKTLLAKSLARSIGGKFQRIQCTPDLLPTDITGTNIWDPGTRKFEFLSGPVFTNILLADEINRATPRTQSALLEVMEEKQVTLDGVTRNVPHPFFVIATQNPIEYQGTFPLPEAQMDRFALSMSLGYPSKQEEIKMLEKQALGIQPDDLLPSISLDELSQLQQMATKVKIVPELQNYIVSIVQATRLDEEIILGASPRASIALQKVSQSWAFLSGRDYIIPDDVKFIAPYALAHRLVPVAGKSALKIVERILNITPIETRGII
jgi:MoxR-like ATPase